MQPVIQATAPKMTGMANSPVFKNKQNIKMATKIAGVGIKMLSSTLGGGDEGGGYEYEYDFGGGEGFDPLSFSEDGSDPTAAYIDALNSMNSFSDY